MSYFNFLQGGLDLIFLHFQAFLHLLQLMDGFGALTDLIRQVGDLLCWGVKLVSGTFSSLVMRREL